LGEADEGKRPLAGSVFPADANKGLTPFISKRYSQTRKSTRGAVTAEIKRFALVPLNLIWVMPA
jgi:hypothetical protein